MIRISHLVSAVCIVSAVAAELPAQLPSTVQLPTFNTFYYSGTVQVPVNGAGYLGGVRRSASGRVRRPGSRAFGATASHPGMSVHATVIDHDAIDRQLRGLPPKGQVAAQQGGAPNQAANKPGQLVAKVDPDAEGKALVRFARKQFQDGKRMSAFNAYQLAIRTLSPKLSNLAKQEFQRVFPPDPRLGGMQSANRSAESLR